MKTIVLNLFINNSIHELCIDDYSFEYGIGPQKVGEKAIILQYSLKIYGINSIASFKKYIQNVSKTLITPESLNKIQIQIIDHENNDNNQYLTFNNNEFTNFNMVYVIDTHPKGAISFEPILKKE